MKKAWVILWEDYENYDDFDFKNRTESIVLILKGNSDFSYVSELLPALYVAQCKDVDQKFNYAVSNNVEKNELGLETQFSLVRGEHCSRRMWVGQAPLLVAKLVENFEMKGDPLNPIACWDEIRPSSLGV
ncbi:hypothetical protein [Proteus mirabilis]|uniref:hypothetical protein n=1 Tax=Proteus mirabilis TaxID=584 RepID=UPI001FAE74D8|nr:hypothetical protein [Proteus mirabilis]MCI9743086.1 hypothetical protein [Proteus mirabilis]MCI9800850.1 hypothetical protein [Proteus mirabilis]MCI9812406.1 hypothetical protein [Proteus mirabilis]